MQTTTLEKFGLDISQGLKDEASSIAGDCHSEELVKQHGFFDDLDGVFCFSDQQYKQFHEGSPSRGARIFRKKRK